MSRKCVGTAEYSTKVVSRFLVISNGQTPDKLI